MEFSEKNMKNFNTQGDTNDRDSDENLEFLSTRRKNNNFLKLKKNSNNKIEINKENKDSIRTEYKRNLQETKNKEEESKKINLCEIKEKNGDMDFENNQKSLKNINPSNPSNPRPFSRKRSAFNKIEEIEKDETNTENLRNSKENTNNINNFDNFHNLISNKNQNHKEKERMPEIKNPTTFNKIQMPSTNINNYNTYNHNNNSNINTTNNNVVNMNMTHHSNTSSSRRMHENNFNSYNLPQTNMPQSSKKPEIESRRRKLVNNNIFNNEFQENLNLTTANPTSNNLLNFENQIKNGYFSNNNIPTPVNSSKYISNFTEKDTSIGTHNLNNQDKNSVNYNKFNSANSRINSRRQANNINSTNVGNNSYFGNTHIV